MMRISVFLTVMYQNPSLFCSEHLVFSFCSDFYERMHVCCMFHNVPGSSAGVSLLTNILSSSSSLATSLFQPPFTLLCQVLIRHTLIRLFHCPLSWNLSCWELILLWHPTFNFCKSLCVKFVYNSNI